MNKREILNLISELESEIGNFDIADFISENDYADLIDESEEMVEVCGMEFYPSQILRELDNTAFICGYHDYIYSIDLHFFQPYIDLLNELDLYKEMLEND